MSTWGWITTGYLLVFATMGAYALRTLRRGRELAKQVPDEDKPWT